MYFYCTGTSFQRVEDPCLLRAIQLACPGAQLPTCKQLADDGAGGLLDECYQQVNEEVNKVLSTDGQFVCLTSDAWSNVANNPVVNYMAVSPTKSLFLEAVHTEEQSHDADWLSTDLSRVIDSLGDNVVGAVTDNTAANKKAWSELEKKYPTHFFHGCVPWSSPSCKRYLLPKRRMSQVVALLNIQLVTHLKTCSSLLLTARMLLPFSITTMSLRQC